MVVDLVLSVVVDSLVEGVSAEVLFASELEPVEDAVALLSAPDFKP